MSESDFEDYLPEYAKNKMKIIISGPRLDVNQLVGRQLPNFHVTVPVKDDESSASPSLPYVMLENTDLTAVTFVTSESPQRAEYDAAMEALGSTSFIICCCNCQEPPSLSYFTRLHRKQYLKSNGCVLLYNMNCVAGWIGVDDQWIGPSDHILSLIIKSCGGRIIFSDIIATTTTTTSSSSSTIITEQPKENLQAIVAATTLSTTTINIEEEEEYKNDKESGEYCWSYASIPSTAPINQLLDNRNIYLQLICLQIKQGITDISYTLHMQTKALEHIYQKLVKPELVFIQQAINNSSQFHNHQEAISHILIRMIQILCRNSRVETTDDEFGHELELHNVLLYCPKIKKLQKMRKLIERPNQYIKNYFPYYVVRRKIFYGQDQTGRKLEKIAQRLDNLY